MENLDSCGKDDRVYTLDAEAGKVEFGNGVHGRRPDTGSRMQATIFRYGGGADGNVESGPVITLKWTPGISLRIK